MTAAKCPQCASDADYPMLVSHNPRTLCAHEFHQESISMMLQLSITKFLKLWLGRKESSR